MTKDTNLVAMLLPEVFQAETSAMRHPAREAERLGGAPPAEVMRAVAKHARASRTQLEDLARTRGGTATRLGGVVGRLFSIVRDRAVDAMITSEKSYRGTILGIHHGIGTMLLLEDAAVANNDQKLADFCAAWLAERTRLVAEAEAELAWFAMNPNFAMGRATRAHAGKVHVSPVAAVVAP